MFPNNQVASIASRLRQAMDLRQKKQVDIIKATGINSGALSSYLAGRYEPKQSTIYRLAAYLNISEAWLMGYDVPMERSTQHSTQVPNLPSPTVTTNVVKFPVIGEIAAGFDKIGTEDWTGDTIEIPEAALHGHSREDFFVLRVTGDSMYPHFQDGDHVLVLKQDTLNYSGEVGAILYDDELVSLKKIEYVEGEDWLRMVPINPNHPPKKIEGEALAHCRIIGIPRLLIRKL